MIQLLLNGACGHMGRVVAQLAAGEKDLTVAAGVDACPQPMDFPVFETLGQCPEADAVIDFSTASAVDGLLAYCRKKKLPLVLCSTGLTEAQLESVKEAAREIPVLRSANMSLGINTLLKLVREAAAVLGKSGFDIEIVEKHHRRKLDAPSGTALMLADAASQGLPEKPEYVFDRSGRRMARPKQEIGISAVRGGSIVGEHEVIFAGQDEVVTISHSAFSRSIFAQGALAAARYLAGKEPGLYSMQDVV